MAYSLVRLALGSYDVLRDGEVVAALVRSGETSDAAWTAELLEDLALSERPAPFTEIEHRFTSFEEAKHWLAAEVWPSCER